MNSNSLLPVKTNSLVSPTQSINEIKSTLTIPEVFLYKWFIQQFIVIFSSMNLKL